MNCKKADKYLGAFVDGELKGWWLRRALIKHLDKCTLCQKMVEIQRQIKNLLQTKVSQVTAPIELKLKIQKELHQEFSD